MILEAQNCPSAGSFVVGDLDRSGPPDCRASMMASAYVISCVSHDYTTFQSRLPLIGGLRAVSRPLRRQGCPAGELVQYLQPASPCLFTKRARRAGRPSNFGAHRMHRASRLCSSRIVVSAAQSPKVEWLLRALRLKAFPTQSRPVEHSAPLVRRISSPK